jgi:hypothetical protein
MDEPVLDVGSQTPVSTVQVNSYCAYCNYNLYSQKVSRDDRLGILVCRCPECGRFTAAGAMSTANQKLMQRLSTGAIIIYVGFLIGLLAIFATVLGVCQAGILQNRYWIDYPPPANPNWNPSPDQFSIRPALISGAITGSLLGGFFAVFCWHWRRHWRFLAAVAPLLIALLVWNTWDVPNYGVSKIVPRSDLVGWGIRWLSVIAGVQILSIIVGELTGRPIGRLVLRILVPASLLQYLSFLWYVDGKSPPSPRNVNVRSSV